MERYLVHFQDPWRKPLLNVSLSLPSDSMKGAAQAGPSKLKLDSKCLSHDPTLLFKTQNLNLQRERRMSITSRDGINLLSRCDAISFP